VSPAGFEPTLSA